MPDASARLRALGVELKVLADRDLKLEMTRGLKAGAAPLIPLVKQAAMTQLPKAGGLNKRVAGQKVSVSVTTSARNAGVRLRTTAPDTKETDSGFVRHPVFGVWREGVPSQEIPAAKGWWSDTLAKSAPAVTPALNVVLLRIETRLRGI